MYYGGYPGYGNYQQPGAYQQPQQVTNVVSFSLFSSVFFSPWGKKRQTSERLIFASEDLAAWLSLPEIRLHTSCPGYLSY
jgi:hypothetical protein